MNNIRWPEFIKEGDQVALVATARHANQDDIDRAIAYLESWNLKVLVASNLFKKHHIFSGTETERRKPLQQCMDNPEVKAIFCLRGGYGTHRLIDFMHFKGIKRNPKWIIGYSDVTVLLNHLAQYRIPSVHGPMPFSFYKGEEKEGAEALKFFLFGALPTHQFPGHELNVKGIAEGIVIGGNLSVLHSIMGTSSDVSWKRKILFIEEVDEYIYHIDRMLYHIKRTGRLEGLAGMIVGHLTGIKDNAEPFGLSAHETIARIVKPYNIPLAFGFPAGHELPNLPLLIGAKARLEVSEKESSLTYLK